MCPPYDVKTMETSGFCATDSMGIAKEKTFRIGYLHDGVIYYHLYNNKINARVLIGQSAMVYCAGKPIEELRLRLVIYKFFSCSTNIPRGL